MNELNEKNVLKASITAVLKAVREGEKNKQTVTSFVCNAKHLSDFDALLLACKHDDEKKLVLEKLSQTFRDCRKRKQTIFLDTIAPAKDDASPYGYQLGIMKGKVEFNKIPKPLNKADKQGKLDDEKTALQQAVKIANIEKSAVLTDNENQQKTIAELTKMVEFLTFQNTHLALENKRSNRHISRYKTIVKGLKERAITAENLLEVRKAK